jgi:hypothetical protein
MWVCSVIYHTKVNYPNNEPQDLMIQTPIAYHENLYKLVESLPTQGYTSQYINEWIHTWMNLDEYERKQRVRYITEQATACNMPLETSLGVIHMDFIRLEPMV